MPVFVLPLRICAGITVGENNTTTHTKKSERR
jgi:hypothetical protein